MAADQPHRVVPFPDTDHRRLRRALGNLNRALDEQRDAVAALRAQLAALNGALASLDSRGQPLIAALGQAATDTATAEAASRAVLAMAHMVDGRASAEAGPAAPIG